MPNRDDTGDFFRPTDPDFLADPYPTFARLRKEKPFFFYEPWNAWLVFRHAQVSALLKDRRLGRVLESSGEGPAGTWGAGTWGAGTSGAETSGAAPLGEETSTEGAGELEAYKLIQKGSLMEIEPPDHTRIRRSFQTAFSPLAIQALSSRVERHTEQLIDDLLERPLEADPSTGRMTRKADLLQHFAQDLPLRVITEMLGVPLEERIWLLQWSRAIIALYEPEPSEADRLAAEQAAKDFHQFLHQRIQDEKTLLAIGTEPTTVLAQMIQSQDGPEADRLTDNEIIANSILLLNAGHEAVVNVLGNGFHALLSQPQRLKELFSDLDLIPTAVEEMMRFDTPAVYFQRIAREEIEVGGILHPRGTRFTLFLASANHDEDVFTQPELFDLRRTPNPHLAFGAGLHFCLGAPLARLELQIALRHLAVNLPNLRLDPAAPAPKALPKNVFRFRDSLPVLY